MKTFKIFFEDNELAIREPLDVGVAEPSFTDFLQWLIKSGANIQHIVDLGAFDVGVNRILKPGGRDGNPVLDAAVDFHEALTRFVNRDEKGRGPGSFLPRAYDKDEFKQQHNYDEYVKLDTEWRKAFQAKIIARQAKDQEGLAAAESEMLRLGDLKNNSEYIRARRVQSKKEDQYVKDLQTIPFSDKELADDGSEEYKAAAAAYNDPDFNIKVYMKLLKTQAEAWKNARRSP